MRIRSFAPIALLAAALFSGCTSNPFITFQHPNNIAPANLTPPPPEAVKPASDTAAPLVIEITDSRYPVEYILRQCGLGDDFIALATRDRYQKRHHAELLETAPLRALWWSANVNLYKTELAETLRAAFPDAIVYVRAVPYSERVNFVRTFPPRFNHRSDPAALPPHPLADLVVSVDNHQGINGNDANFAGMTFGSHFFVNFRVAPADAPAAPFVTRPGSDQSTRADQAMAAAYSIEPTPEELAATRAKIQSRHWTVDVKWADPGFARRFLLNYPGDETYLALAESHIARQIRPDVHKAYYLGAPRARTDAATLQAWNNDPATSPLAPFYKWTATGVGEIAPLAASPEARVARLSAWAAFYESDPAIRSAFAAHAAGMPGAPARDTLPPKARALLRLRDAEIAFLVRHGQALAEAPARGELGAFARESALEQEGLRQGFQNRLLAANLIGFAGAGIGAGMAGSASALAAHGASQATLVSARAMISDTLSDAQEGAAHMAAAISDQIGAITIDLDGQSVAITAPDFAAFRAQARELYLKL
jgi:hypothetical protein